MTYYAEWYTGDRRFRSPDFDSLEELKAYTEDIPNARIYCEED